MKRNGELLRNDYVPTLSNLREQFLISNPNDYIKKFRSSFLRWVREGENISKADIETSCGIAVKDLERIESGQVNEGDLMNLQKLAKRYSISYFHLLAAFKLVKKQQKNSDFKMAAYADTKMDEETIKRITEFIVKLKDEKRGRGDE